MYPYKGQVREIKQHNLPVTELQQFLKDLDEWLL